MRVLLFLLLLGGQFAHAAETDLHLDGAITQGGMVRGATTPGARVSLDGRAVRVSPAGKFVFGFGRDFKGPTTLEVTPPGGEVIRKVLEVEPRTYKTERVDGLAPAMVTPPEEVLARIRAENLEIGKVRSGDNAMDYVFGDFAWPAKGRVSGVYGSQRILNGEPKRPHFGLDVAAPEGTPVIAPAGGVVALAEEDLYYTGGTIMLDHGHGGTSIFMHLSALEVAEGAHVAQGDLIGRIGSTGRATGAHLDWRVNWFDRRLDPEMLLKPR